MLRTERKMENKELYKLLKGKTNKVTISIGNGFDDYEELNYLDVNILWVNNSLDYDDATTISYYFTDDEQEKALKQAEKQAKVLVNTLKKYVKVEYEGLENC